MEWLSNFGMREWLISCGIVLVLVVLADGFRRMRAERRGEIKMSLRMGGEFPDLPEEETSTAELPNGGARVVNRDEPSIDDRYIDLDETDPEYEAEATDTRSASHATTEPDIAFLDEASAESPGYLNDQEILVIHAKSQDKDGFNGSDLLQVLLACDLRYGDRDILHRHERAGGQGQLQFSVANMVEPGTFNLEDIGSFRTPGVTFFMTLPGADRPDEAFNCMIETANCLAKNLDADLLDDSHQTLTDQTLKTYENRVRRFVAATA